MTPWTPEVRERLEGYARDHEEMSARLTASVGNKPAVERNTQKAKDLRAALLELDRLTAQAEAMRKATKNLCDAAETNLKIHTLGTVNKLVESIEAARHALESQSK